MKVKGETLKKYSKEKNSIKLNSLLTLAKEYVKEQTGKDIERMDLLDAVKTLEVETPFLKTIRNENYYINFLSASFYYFDIVIRGDYQEKVIAALIQKTLAVIQRRNDSVPIYTEETKLFLEFMNQVKLSLKLRLDKILDEAKKLEDREWKVIGTECTSAILDWIVASENQISNNKNYSGLKSVKDEYTYLEEEFKELKKGFLEVDTMYAKKAGSLMSDMIDLRCGEEPLMGSSITKMKSSLITGISSPSTRLNPTDRVLTYTMNIFKGAYLLNVSILNLLPMAALTDGDKRRKKKADKNIPRFEFRTEHFNIKELKKDLEKEIIPLLNLENMFSLGDYIGIDEGYKDKLKEEMDYIEDTFKDKKSDYLLNQDVLGLMRTTGWNPAFGDNTDFPVSSDRIVYYLFKEGIEYMLETLDTKNPKVFFMISRIPSIASRVSDTKNLNTDEGLLISLYLFLIALKLEKIIIQNLVKSTKEEKDISTHFKKSWLLEAVRLTHFYLNDVRIRNVLEEVRDKKVRDNIIDTMLEGINDLEKTRDEAQLIIDKTEDDFSMFIVKHLEKDIKSVPSYLEFFSGRLGQSKAVLSKMMNGKRRIPNFLYLYDIIQSLGYDLFDVLPEEVLGQVDKNFK